ncbi:MAG: hypothetical protein IAF58_17310 [Leptolyngbya sp.]|nr:hypothetical protein [Candidatus Melainabacteria bacterium]
MSFESHSGAEISKMIGGEKNVKDFSVLDELRESLNNSGSKVEYKGSNEKHGACGFDGFSVGEASPALEKNMVSSVSKGEGKVVGEVPQRKGDSDDAKLDLSVSLSAMGETPLSRTMENAKKINGDLVSTYDKVKTFLGDPGQKIEVVIKVSENSVSKFTQIRS